MIANDVSMTAELMPWNGILLMTDVRMMRCEHDVTTAVLMQWHVQNYVND